jgi:formylglycine-generating enzyme required for sulfatase activity
VAFAPDGRQLYSVGADLTVRQWQLPVPAPIFNSIGMQLAPIPAGKFLMGSPESEVGRKADEGPQHEVTITRPFYMGVHEVTQQQYQAVIGNNPSWFSATGGGKDQVSNLNTDDFPVETASWIEAVEFCRRLSELPEEKRLGRSYRLPTDAEWEYACRAGTTTPFHLGTVLVGRLANFKADEPYGEAAKEAKPDRVVKVGSYAPNGFGLYDMHGNVNEFCSDWHDVEYYKKSPSKDPQGPQHGEAHVTRSGAWNDAGRFCRAANRGWSHPDWRYQTIGFRVVMVIDAEKVRPRPAPVGIKPR